MRQAFILLDNPWKTYRSPDRVHIAPDRFASPLLHCKIMKSVSGTTLIRSSMDKEATIRQREDLLLILSSDISEYKPPKQVTAAMAKDKPNRSCQLPSTASTSSYWLVLLDKGEACVADIFLQSNFPDFTRLIPSQRIR